MIPAVEVAVVVVAVAILHPLRGLEAALKGLVRITPAIETCDTNTCI